MSSAASRVKIIVLKTSSFFARTVTPKLKTMPIKKEVSKFLVGTDMFSAVNELSFASSVCTDASYMLMSRQVYKFVTTDGYAIKIIFCIITKYW